MRVLPTRMRCVSDARNQETACILSPQLFLQKAKLLLPIFFLTFIFFNEKIVAQGCDNVINGGLIEADEFGCPNPVWDPSIITNVALPQGGTGDLEFVWMYTTDDPTQPLSMWSPIPNSNSPEYDPLPISVTTYYTRCARRAGCTDYVGESNIVVKEAICCDNVTDGGEIAADQVFCEPPYDPTALVNVVSPSGGSLALEYQWIVSTTGTPYNIANPDWTEITGANSDSYDPGVLTETTYFIRLSRRHGCYDYDGVSNMVTIVVSEEIVATLAGTDESCLSGSDGSISIDNISGGTPDFTYEWDDPLNQTTNEITDLATGLYTVTVTDANGCTGTASQMLNDGPPLQVVTAADAVSCPGDTDGKASVLSVNGLAPYSYQWDDPNLQTTETASDLAPGNYQVVVTDDFGCIGTGTAVVEDADPLVISTFSTDASCSDASDGTATVQVTGGVTPYSYEWSDPDAQTTATAFNLPYGSYSVTVTDANGCTAEATEMVTAPMQAEVNLAGMDVTCFGFANGSAEATIVGGDVGFYNFQWDDPAMSTTSTVTGLGPGTYNVTVTDTIGCMVESGVTIDEPTELTLATQSDSASCSNASDGTAIVFPVGGTPFGGGTYDYVWNAPGSPMVQMLDDVSPGTYTVTVTDANNCTESASVEIGAPAPLLVTFNIEHVSCAGFADGSTDAMVVGGTSPYSYQWDAPGNPTTASLSGLPPGDYSLTVTDAQNCMTIATATITEPLPLTLGFDNIHVVCEEDTDGVAQAVVTGGTTPYSYLWGGGEMTVGISGLGVGTYNVTVTDGNGCTISAGTQINFTSTLSSTATETDATCFDVNNGSATASGVDGTLPYSYLWSNGEMTATINDLFFGVYTVTVTDGDGCTSTSTAAVNAPPLLICDVQILSEVLTYGGTEGSASASALGGVAPYTFEWSNGSISPTANDLGAGTHTVTVTDANGCVCIREIELIDPSKIGNYVWNDENQNGIQDFDEVGIEGITVHLTGETNTGDPVSITTMTDVDGEYAFDGLTAGFYEVEMETPANHTFTYQDVGNDNLDSDIDPATGMTETFVISQGVFDARWDGGMIVLDEFIDIGDFVWYDINHNGLQDLNEAGVEGVTVKLISGTTNQILEVTQTNQLGYYLFEDVLPGDYIVEFSLASFPSGGYILSPKDEGTDDTIDSDADEMTGRTDVFTVFPFTLDNLTIDAGIFKECDNITDGGLIGYDEDLCGIGADPDEIVNLQSPSGGFGTIEYLWMFSNVPIYNGPGDPNWQIIPNSNSPTYDPGPISVSTYYIRCARREGCVDYIGESNIVAKEITAFPLTQIIDQPNTLCMNEGSRWEAAIAGAGATYFWDFGPDATPGTATTRVVDPVSWSTQGMKTVELTVTRFGCSFTVSSTVFIDDCNINPLIVIDDVFAELTGESVELTWTALGDLENVIFSVQCSEDGVNYQNLSVLSANAGAENGEFEFIDLKPRLGENTYRIKFEKLGDDVSGYSTTATIYFQPEGVGLVSTYPNPTTGKVTVELLKPTEAVSILRVFDAMGNMVQMMELEPETEKVSLDLSDVQIGVYLIEVQQSLRKPQVCRVFKAER